MVEEIDWLKAEKADWAKNCEQDCIYDFGETLLQMFTNALNAHLVAVDYYSGERSIKPSDYRRK